MMYSLTDCPCAGSCYLETHPMVLTQGKYLRSLISSLCEPSIIIYAQHIDQKECFSFSVGLNTLLRLGLSRTMPDIYRVLYD